MNTFSGLVSHFRKMHLIYRYCPICKREFSDLQKHFFVLKDACQTHQLFWALSARKTKKNREALDKARDEAMELLYVEATEEDFKEYWRVRKWRRRMETGATIRPIRRYDLCTPATSSEACLHR